jgi:intein/homing endonuclease
VTILAKLRALAKPSYVAPAGQASLPARPALTVAAPNLKRTVRQKLSRGSVEWSQDLARILALPRRPKPDLKAVADELTVRLRKPGGTMSLREIQAWVIWEGAQVGGLMGQVAVGGGKCVDFSTEIFDASSGRRRLAGEVGRYSTVAMGKTGKLLLSDAVAVLSGKKLCYRLTLADGSAVILSADHPVFTPRGWVPVALLKNELVAVPRQMPGPSQPLSITDDELKLVAYLIADGSTVNGTPMFSDENPKVLEELQVLAERLADASQNLNTSSQEEGPKERPQRSKAREFNLRGLSWLVRKWDLKALSKEKQVPAEFWGLSNRQTALFLNRFFACDGHISMTKGLEIVLASEKLINDLKFMLLRLGVMSRKRFKLARIGKKTYDAWRLNITGENVDRFFENVGDVWGSEERSQRALTLRRSTETNTNVDVVPIGPSECSMIADEMSWPGRGRVPKSDQRPRLRTEFRRFLGATDGQFVSREKFKLACERFGYNGRLRWLADNELAWEKVSSLEFVGERDVYDLSVPGPESFIGNGIVLHNTLCGLLMPMAMASCRRAVLFIPPALRAQLYEKDLEFYGKHWNLPNLAGGNSFIPGRPVLHVVAYSELSSPKSSELLKQLNPDLVIADEAHSLRHRDTARTRRFLRYFADFPDTRFCGWSGTLTAKSVRDYAHLSALALGEGSPVPLHPPTVEEWAAALDPDGTGFFDAGQLRRFCEPDEEVRKGFRRRLTDTSGVVATAENLLGTSLIFYQRPAPPIPQELQEHLRKLRKSPQEGGWIRPDGEELVDALRVSACARQLACGFYGRWKFPRGEKPEVIDDWFARRQEWNRELRDRLQRSAPHLDSPNLCMRAAIRFYDGGCPGCERGPMEQHSRKCKEADTHPLWASKTWPVWSKIHKSVYHEEEVVWVSDYLLEDVMKWANEAPGIIWIEHVPVGERLSRLGKLPYYGGGEQASADIIKETGQRSVIASVKAHYQGKNLQMFNRNLIVAMPSDGAVVEQLIGRTHREGQKADEVEVFIYQHTPEFSDALSKAKARARYIDETTGSAQKLVYGSWTF